MAAAGGKVAAVADEESLLSMNALEGKDMPRVLPSTKTDTEARFDEQRGGQIDGGDALDFLEDDDSTDRLMLSFPTFTLKELVEYFSFASRSINAVYLLPFAVFATTPIVARYIVALMGSTSPVLIAGFCSFLVAYVLFVAYFTPMFFRLYAPLKVWGRRVGALMVKYSVKDVIVVNGMICSGLLSVFRVVNGQCPAGTSVWQSQTCNPYASSGSIPVDDAMFLFIIPIGMQILFRPSLHVLVVMWVVAVAIVLFNICYVDAGANGWVLGYAPIFMNVSSEYERLSRLTFVLTKKAHEQRVHEVQSAATLLRAREQQLEAEAQQSRLQAETMSQKHALEAVQRDRSNEALLAQKEQEQLRAIIGNVAHDLKTPLFSISAEIDTLQVPPIYPYLGPHLSLSRPLSIPI
jgi:hypothetical protein